MEAKVALGKVVRELRESLGLSQEKLAEKTGISYQYLSSIENGKENFTIGVLESLATSLNTSISSLMRRATTGTEYPRIDPEYLQPGPTAAKLDIEPHSARSRRDTSCYSFVE